MSQSLDTIQQRIKSYCSRRKLEPERQLGAGLDGVVIATTRRTAVKGFLYERHYLNELAVYRRLQERHIRNVAGFAVPQFIGHHDELLVVEMEIVNPSFVVDFAGAYLDRRPPFSEEEWEVWEAEREELFGDDWSTVRTVLARIIHGVDVDGDGVVLDCGRCDGERTGPFPRNLFGGGRVRGSDDELGFSSVERVERFAARRATSADGARRNSGGSAHGGS